MYTIIFAVVFIIYMITAAWSVKNYKNSLMREYRDKMMNQVAKLIQKDIHVEMLKDRISYQKRAFAQYVEDAIKEREELHKMIKLLTPTEPDGM